jgi:hypothetical protein
MFYARQHNMDWEKNLLPYRDSGFYGHFPRNGYTGYVVYVFPAWSKFSRLVFTYWGKPIRKRLELQRKGTCFYCAKPGRQNFTVRFKDDELHTSYMTTACDDHRGRKYVSGSASRERGAIKAFDFKGVFDGNVS